LRLLSRAARGSMRDALSLADQAIAFGGGTLLEDGVRQMLGAVDRSHAVRLIEALVAGDGAALVNTADALRTLGLSASGTLEEMAALLQQMAVAAAVPSAIDAADTDSAAVLRLAPLLAADETQLFYSMALHGRAELGLAPDEYSGLVMVLLRMLAFKQPGSAAAAAGTVSGSGASVASASPRAEAALAATPRAAVATVATVPVRVKPVPTPAPTPALSPAPSPAPSRMAEPPPWAVESHEEIGEAPGTALSATEAVEPSPEPSPKQVVAAPALRVFAPTELGDRWAQTVTAMTHSGSIGAMVRELAMQSQCVEVDAQAQPELWRLRLDRESLRATVHRDKLQAALAEHLGHAVSLDLVAGEAQDSPAQRATAERDRRQHAAEQIIHNDPLVLALMAQYKTARIVPGSIKPH
jgi:DNA polymerase III subunit gamma/tau